MEGKGIIRFFLIILAVVCFLQYLYLLPTRKIEKAAEKYAQELADNAAADEADVVRKEARVRYLDSMSSETVVKIPFLAEYTYEDLKSRQLAYGLDLKGGLAEVLQVNLREFIRTLSRDSKDPTFLAALDAADDKLSSAQADLVTLFAQEWASRADGKKLASIFAKNPALRSEINFETSDDEVIRLLRSRADETVDLTFKRLKDRIDKFGVTQPNVSLDKNRDLIIVELPGVDNPERARKYLQASAELEFWNVYRLTGPIQEAFVAADRKLKAEQEGDSTLLEEKLSYELVPRYEISYDTLGNPVDSVETGIDTVQLAENPFESGGPLLSLLTLNGQTGQLQFPLHVAGAADKNKKAAITSMLAREDIKSLFPADLKFLWSYKQHRDYVTNEETGLYLLHMIKLERGSDKAPLLGDRVVRATSQPDPTSGEVEVSLSMDQAGAQTWGQLTTAASQDDNREIAIVLDNEVVSAPSVRVPIMDGRSSITGNFDIQEGQDLANVLEVGKLPAQTEIIQETLVGPSLGKSNIQRSQRSLMIGFILLVIFMVLYYSSGGLVAIIALFANVFFIFGALSSLGTVLTLPGIAGILLTIGMAVDANVIIFERIREELRIGKTLRTAIADGFSHSYSAIIDANVTTILVAVVLAYFGLGPIKGFAVVLIIGVISSLVTAVLLGRLMIDWWTDSGRELSFWNNWSKDVFANLNIDWLGKRKIGYVISGVLLLASIGSILTKGFEFGVDFKGGYSYNVELAEGTNATIEEMRAALEVAFDGAPTTVKAVDLSNTYNITTSYRIDESGNEVQDEVTEALFNGVNQVAGGQLDLANFKNPDGKNTHLTSSSKVGPTIADDIKNSSVKAAVFALLLIFLYILLRFSRWQYSLGAIVALVHDSIIVMGIFSLFHGVFPFSMEIDQAFIAALLTVIGYSINDTVVVFDRIREFLGIYINRSKTEVINMAINTTFSRTIITSLTTLFVVGILFAFGGGSIKGFAFALLIGIMVGTYSSIFVATPVVHDLTDDMASTKAVQRRQYSKSAKS
jgi:SecD/SecF fusion protein